MTVPDEIRELIRRHNARDTPKQRERARRQEWREEEDMKKREAARRRAHEAARKKEYEAARWREYEAGLRAAEYERKNCAARDANIGSSRARRADYYQSRGSSRQERSRSPAFTPPRRPSTMSRTEDRREFDALGVRDRRESTAGVRSDGRSWYQNRHGDYKLY
ncbi:hypothetical protein LTR64_000673 [Lithohypha guttulata]|uniref:uncharacterized protein n=1 Tax=Lithohypha guttulata TaxID=1690604 RepID=UPI002DDE234A|nr:hypothetical protein LTR51_005558 [Lithohypha guttulata]